MELLREAPIFEDIEIQEITEGADDGLKLLKIKGTASRGNIFNRNKRMYPTEVLTKVAEKSQSALKKGKFTGQLDHPSFFGGGGDLERTAIKFTNMWMEGDDLKFEGNVIPTTPGKELEALLRAKVGVGMSTRGYGTMKPHIKADGKEDHTKMVIQDDFDLYGVDAVLNESNQYGQISQFEHKEGGNNVELTLKELKEKHVNLVDELKQEFKAELEADFDTKVSEALIAKVEEEKEAYKQEVFESEEVKQLQEFVNAVKESIKPLMPGQKEFEESQQEKELKDLKAQLESLKVENEAALTKAVKEAEALKVQQAQLEEKAKVAKHVETKVEGHRFAGQLQKRLSECASVEEVDTKFDEEVAYIESLIKPVEDPKGEGKVNKNPEDDSTKSKQLDEEKQRQRKLAGIEEIKEGGK